jgi:hypothetical protein
MSGPLSIDVSRIMAYEDGSLDEEETVQLFQDLVDAGTIWHLQGHYQRMAHAFHDAGLVIFQEDKQ